MKYFEGYFIKFLLMSNTKMQKVADQFNLNEIPGVKRPHGAVIFDLPQFAIIIDLHHMVAVL